jgi:CheY-like chemotaxis protein
MGASSASPRILIVDDEPILVEVLREILGGEYRVAVATSGARGLQLARSQAFDLVLLDLHLADMDGREVCRQLKADPSTAGVPVVFVTGSGGAVAELEAAGAADVLAKPVEAEEVRGCVAALLRRPA